MFRLFKEYRLVNVSLLIEQSQLRYNPVWDNKWETILHAGVGIGIARKTV
jgi:hypothetical protein